MPAHDWTRVETGIFHDFHTVWIAEIRNALNEGLLPAGFYALAEQHAGQYIADVLTLHTSTDSEEPLLPLSDTGGVAVAEAPPKVRQKLTLEPAALALRRTLAIRHVSDHRLVAVIEIVSPANKDRAEHVDDFTSKAAAALRRGVHLLVADLFPPGRHDAEGMHGKLQQRIGATSEPYVVPGDEPITLAAYVAGPVVDVYMEHVAVGAELPQMPLFLRFDRYINVPLEETYQIAYRGTPAFWRDVLEEDGMD